jgi:hypothetical protein
MRANLYLTELDELPPRYAGLDVVYDDGSGVGWEYTVCTRCNARFRAHTWALYLISPSGEAVSDCSEDPR